MAHTGGPPVYDTVTSSRYTSAGIALIIVNQKFHVPGYGERRGAGEDARLLKETFEKLGFIVIEHFNKTARDIRRAVRDVCRLDHSACANFVMAISSHGERFPNDSQLRNYDSVVGVDGQQVDFYTLTSYFSDRMCPTLKGKPKLFFIQACRGLKLHEEAEAEQSTTVMAPVTSDSSGGDDEVDPGGSSPRPNITYSDDIPLMRDFLLACSVPPEFFAFHNTQGSWFIRVLCQVLLEQHEHRDLLSMLTEVNWRVATEFTTNTKANHPEFHGRRTMPWVASMLRKDVKV